MKAQFKNSKEGRKTLLEYISLFTGYRPVFNGVPRCSHNVGPFELSRECCLSWEGVNASELLDFLENAGFPYHLDGKMPNIPALRAGRKVEEEAKIDGLTISLPRTLFTEEALENLKRLVEGKAELIRRAFKCDTVELSMDEERIVFPWFEPGTQEEIRAYGEFVAALGKMARKQKRVTVRPKEIQNEKYEFRCFLLRLGFIGDDYKETRKVLLSNLSGSPSFLSGQKGE